MFVLPPPPRYPNQAAYNAAVAAGQAAPMIETNNTISNPTGPQYQLVVGEGTYTLKEDLLLATPPPHPSEVPILNPNPLATTPQPATAGTKVSILSLSSRSAPALLYSLSSSSSRTIQTSIQEHPSENGNHSDVGTGSDTGGLGTSFSDTATAPVSLGSAPAFGEGNVMLSTTASRDNISKKRKPKNNIAKSNSSFISRVIVHEGLSKRLSDRPADGLFAFANVNRAFQWIDMSSSIKQEPLTKILFTKGHCLCHNINEITKSSSHIDLIMGFSTGEIIWYEPMSQKYARLNKNGVINATPVSEIRWVPGSETLFMAAHIDGSIVVYDKEKDDTIFVPEEVVNGTKSNGYGGGNSRTKIQIKKSVHSKIQKTNPVAFWKLSNQRVNAFAFSPDSRHLAVVSEDGSLRIIDYLKEQLLDLYTSYYGGFMCVCWSPDGKYILTGGQDDLVSIWSFAEHIIVARCEGHQSWVTAVAFDPWRCDDRNYRFGSVGEDSRLLLWDFSVGMLHRPRAASVRQRNGPQYRTESHPTTTRIRSNSNLSSDASMDHPVEPRAQTAMLPPVLNKTVDNDPLCWLEFTADSIMTSCKTGHLRTWNRPRDGSNEED